MKDYEIEAIEKFVKYFDESLKDFVEYTQYLNEGGINSTLRVEGIKILQRKLKQMKEAENKKELKKVINVKKVVKHYGE